MKKSIQKNIILITGVAFTFLGIVVLIAGIIRININNAFMEKAVPVDAVIVEISNYDFDTDTEDIYASYEYNGKEYDHVKVHFSSPDIYEGQEMVFYIDPENPTKIKTAEDNRLEKIVIFSVGGFLLIIGIPLLLGRLFRRINRNKLIENGKHIYATIDRIQMDERRIIGGIHPYNVFCSYNNPSDGMTYNFKSDYITFNPKKSYNVGDKVDVYVNPENFKNYYVEIVDKMG